MFFNQRQVVLASASPRREQILRQIGIEPELCPVTIKEVKELSNNMDPEMLVSKNAAYKAKKAVAKYEDALVLAADTIVFLDNKIYGKPSNKEEAYQMLKTFSGRTHTVYTGIFLIDSKNGYSAGGVDHCEVTFQKLSNFEIEEYLNELEPYDKAGAYAIQGKGAFLIKKINGDYYTVMGLSLSLLRYLFKLFNFF